MHHHFAEKSAGGFTADPDLQPVQHRYSKSGFQYRNQRRCPPGFARYRNPRRRPPGFTLLELLIALTVAALLVMAGIPLLSLPQRSIQSSQLLQLTGFLNLARSHAVSLGRRVTLCGSLDGEHCNAEWSQGHSILLFLDSNENRRFDDGERLLLADNSLGGRWQWRGSGLRSYMRYGPIGQAVDFGSFYLCPTHPDDDGRRLRINAAGRSYRDSVARDVLVAKGICQ